jgi:acyl dehydratase
MLQGPLQHAPWETFVERVGRELGVSPWITIDQAMIDAFARLTGDGHPIHVDPVDAAGTPLGGTIAHGFLTLSLLAQMAYRVVPALEGARFPLNYGFDRVRFVAPVPSGSRVRGRFVLRSADVIAADQRQAVVDATVEIDGAGRPAIVAEWLTRWIV